MTAVIQAVKAEIRVPSASTISGTPPPASRSRSPPAQFVREIFTGVFASDMGLWAPDCATAARLRAQLGRKDLKLMFNVNAEFAFSLDQRPIELRARSAVFSSVADAILVSGPLTGEPVDQSDLRKVREAVPRRRSSPTPASRLTMCAKFLALPTA